MDNLCTKHPIPCSLQTCIAIQNALDDKSENASLPLSMERNHPEELISAGSPTEPELYLLS